MRGLRQRQQRHQPHEPRRAGHGGQLLKPAEHRAVLAPDKPIPQPFFEKSEQHDGPDENRQSVAPGPGPPARRWRGRGLGRFRAARPHQRQVRNAVRHHVEQRKRQVAVEQHDAHVPRHQRAGQQQVARHVEGAGAVPAPGLAGHVSCNQQHVEHRGHGAPGGPVALQKLPFHKPAEVAPRREVPVQQRVDGGVVNQCRGQPAARRIGFLPAVNPQKSVLLPDEVKHRQVRQCPPKHESAQAMQRHAHRVAGQRHQRQQHAPLPPLHRVEVGLEQRTVHVCHIDEHHQRHPGQ